MILAVYNGRYAISGLPTPQLLDAALTIPDVDDEYVEPLIPNAMALSKIHQAAFDSPWHIREA